jgi:predicted flap endonuclease-1-like 5' DNA nuclease
MDFSTFFAGLETMDSTVFLVANLISFLFGFILAWILWGGRARKLRRELEAANAKASAAQTELQAAQEKLTLANTEIAELNESLEISQTNMQNLQLDYDRLRTSSRGLEEQNEQLATMVETYETNIEALNEQVLGLRTRNQALADEVERSGGNTETTVEGLAQMQSTYNATLQRLTAFETKLSNLEEQNQHLQAELENLKAGGAPLELGAIHDAGATTSPKEQVKEVVDVEAAREAAKASVAAAIGNKIPKVKAKKKDDLKLINGVGPFLEGQLNDINIYGFSQIAAFDDELVNEVTTAIGFFPGRILRDDWIGQAARLAAIKEEHPEALATDAVFPQNPSDLKIIEGIGPKIEKVLNDAGIANWSDLAAAEEEGLRAILQEAGDRYRMHNPSTWPKQAGMAVKGKWKKLKEYQDFLKGGREA